MIELLNCSSRAAITVNHRLGSLHNENTFFHSSCSPGGWQSGSRYWLGWFLLRAVKERVSSRLAVGLFSLSLHILSSLCVSLCANFSLYEDTSPTGVELTLVTSLYLVIKIKGVFFFVKPSVYITSRSTVYLKLGLQCTNLEGYNSTYDSDLLGLLYVG